MKHWSIKWRVMLLALLPAAIIAVLLAAHFTDSRIRDIEKELRERGQVIARQLEIGRAHV